VPQIRGPGDADLGNRDNGATTIDRDIEKEMRQLRQRKALSRLGVSLALFFAVAAMGLLAYTQQQYLSRSSHAPAIFFTYVDAENRSVIVSRFADIPVERRARAQRIDLSDASLSIEASDQGRLEQLNASVRGLVRQLTASSMQASNPHEVIKGLAVLVLAILLASAAALLLLQLIRDRLTRFILRLVVIGTLALVLVKVTLDGAFGHAGLNAMSDVKAIPVQSLTPELQQHLQRIVGQGSLLETDQ
jgi:hypothetical protein